MFVNLATQNAAVLLNHLKNKPGMKLHEFCTETGLSKAFMEQIGLRLVRAGILRSNRGPGGGYVLVKQNVNLADLVTVFYPKKKTGDDDLNQQVLSALNTITVI